MTDPSDAQLADLIDRAANKLDDLGWTQSKLWEGSDGVEPQRYSSGAVCAVGALILAAGGIEEVDEQRRDVIMARDAIETILESEWDETDLAEWNDESTREKAEVIDVFRTTARSLRPEFSGSGN